jgi:PAS domain S-box-containing protein
MEAGGAGGEFLASGAGPIGARPAVKTGTMSIAARISLALALVTLAMIGTVVGGSILAARSRDRVNLRIDVDRTTDQLAVGLSLPLWNFDHAQVDHLMDSVMQREDVYSVEIVQADPASKTGETRQQRIRDARGTVSNQTPGEPPPELLSAEREVLSSHGPIGKVKVSVTPKLLDARLRSRLVSLIVQVASLAVILILGLYLLLWRIVIQPVQSLERFAQALSGAKVSGQPPPAARAGADRFYGELASLRSSIANTFELLETRHAALRKNEAMLSSILNSVPQSIFWKSKDGVYLGCNEIFAKAAGFERPSDLVGLTDFDLPKASREDAEIRRAEDRQVVATGRAKAHIITSRKDQDGSIRWADTTKVPLRDSAGQIYGVLGVYHDITEQRRAEHERRDLEAQLRHSQKMEAIGALAGGIAHDFNNLLSAILGNIELLNQELEADHQARASVAGIGKAANRARDLVRQVVGFSRPAEARVEAVDLQRLVEEVMRLMRSVLPASIELVSKCDDAPPLVLADSSQIHQVLMNLCTNSWQAMENRPGRIEIALGRRTFHDGAPRGLPLGSYASLTVTDTGAGMTDEVRRRIFEPFFTTKADTDGTGLGLSTVRSIVTASRGSIEVESAPGQGSRFIVYLPAAPPQIEASETTRPPVAEAPRSLRVYYVDDEEVLVFLATRQLTQRGHQVRGFTSAEAALEAIKEDPSGFDVLVTDYNMPRMPGLQLVSEVQAVRPGAPVVLTTGYRSAEIKSAASRLNLRFIVDKPSSVDELCAAIDKCAAAAGVVGGGGP